MEYIAKQIVRGIKKCINTERFVRQSDNRSHESKGGEEGEETYLDSRCMWPGPSIGIIIKDLGARERREGGRREAADALLMLVWFQIPLPVGASGGIWREEKLRVRGLAIIWNILVPDVCPHLVDRHYKSAKRRHSFEDISQSRGNVVRDNASDIAPCPACASLRLRVCVCVRWATHA